MGIKAERKTIYDDIATLCDAGLDIRTTKIGHSNAYYLGERLFDDDELKILADATASSRYLTIKKSNELIKKLQTLTSEHKAPALRRSIHIEKRTKSFNEGVFKALDVLQEAIYSDRAAEFTPNEVISPGEKRKAGRKADEVCRISPYQLTWENEKYYVICYSEGAGICRYRVDKMGDVTLTDEKRHALSEDEERRLRSLKSGDMGIERLTLRIRFENSLLDDVIERYGDKIPLRPEGDGYFGAEIETALNAAFWGWLFAFGDRAMITEPQYAVKIAAERLRKTESVYI
jgi:predicted DNA-binding transcriptional regulator YafY